MSNLVRTSPTLATVEHTLDDRTQRLLAASMSPSTRRAYENDLRVIDSWCSDRGASIVPATPATVANFVGDMSAHYAAATVERRVATWSRLHEANEVENPCRSRLVRETLRGLRIEAPRQRVAQPLLVDDLATILDSIDGSSLVDLRDRALLTVGRGLGRRRSELVALNVEDLQRIDHPRGYAVTIQRSKTDQEGKGQPCWLRRSGRPTCPVEALDAWLTAASITEGPVFRSVDRYGNVGGRLSDRSVARIVARRAEEAGLPEGRWSGHSLRAGFATDNARRGASTRSIARQGGWSPTSPSFHRYVRVAAPWEDNAAAEDLL